MRQTGTRPGLAEVDHSSGGPRVPAAHPPRSTVLQKGPVHGGVTEDPRGRLEHLQATLVRSGRQAAPVTRASRRSRVAFMLFTATDRCTAAAGLNVSREMSQLSRTSVPPSTGSSS